MRLELSKQEFEQITCDIECCVQEMEMLSSEVSFYVTDLPDRLRVALEIIGRAK